MLFFCLLLSLSGGCSPAEPVTEPPAETLPPSPSAAPTPSPPPTYTLHEALEVMPESLCSFRYSEQQRGYTTAYTEMPLVDGGYDEASDCFRFYFELASELSEVDVTPASATDLGIAEGEEGRVWKIRLNPAALWANGSPIHASDYLYSVQKCLEAGTDYPRAAGFLEGAAALRGAADFHDSGVSVLRENAAVDGTLHSPVAEWVPGEDGQYRTKSGEALYFSLTEPMEYWAMGYSLSDYNGFGYLEDELYSALSALADETGKIPVTAESRGLLYRFTGSKTWGYEPESALAYYSFYVQSKPEVLPDSIGLFAEDDYTLIYITEAPCTRFELMTALSVPFLVYPPLYEAAPELYGSDAEHYMSYGPYLPAELSEDCIRFRQNESWYGYHDGQHEGQFQTTDIIARLAPNHKACVRLFEAGELDILELSEADFPKYADSPYLLSTEKTYTYRFFFVTDHDALLKLQEKASGDMQPVNKTCLSYQNFRTALSFAIDRQAFTADGALGNIPALGILNSLYYYGVVGDCAYPYRNGAAAKAAICRAYSVPFTEESLEGAYAAFTGFDREYARSLFRAAFDEMTANGDWVDGMEIVLNCAVSSSAISSRLILENQLIQSDLDAATEGTGFEGKLLLNFVSSEDRYKAVQKGEIEMGYGAWGGAALDPYSIMLCYCDADYTTVQELCGFQPADELLTVSVNQSDITKSFTDWSRALVSGGEYAEASPALKYEILAQLESTLLAQRHFIPICSLASVSVHSPRLIFPVKNHDSLYAFGGIRLLRYRQSDSDAAKEPCDAGLP